MSRRSFTRFGILAFLATVRVTQFADAQSLNCPDHQFPDTATAQNVKITIAEVTFSKEYPLVNDARTRLLNDIKQLDLNVSREIDESVWIAEIEALVRDALQERGYFQVLLTSMPYLIRAETNERVYAVNLEIDSGPQYRLDEIGFSGATVFEAAELRAQFSLRHGDLFDVPVLRQGMTSLTRLYSGRGFIDMTPEPEFKIDEQNLLISILVRVDEGKQYHIGNVEVQGLDGQIEQALKSQLNPGRVVDGISLWNFFEEHKTELPKNIFPEDAIRLRRDSANASVDFSVDFRPCPKT